LVVERADFVATSEMRAFGLRAGFEMFDGSLMSWACVTFLEGAFVARAI
jgi:hypothetical protein